MCGSFYNTYHKRNEEHPEMFLSGVDARDTSKATKIYSLLQGSYSPLTGELSLIFLQQNSRKTACLWDWGIMDAYTMIVWQIQVIITDDDKTISSGPKQLVKCCIHVTQIQECFFLSGIIGFRWNRTVQQLSTPNITNEGNIDFWCK